MATAADTFLVPPTARPSAAAGKPAHDPAHAADGNDKPSFATILQTEVEASSAAAEPAENTTGTSIGTKTTPATMAAAIIAMAAGTALEARTGTETTTADAPADKASTATAGIPVVIPAAITTASPAAATAAADTAAATARPSIVIEPAAASTAAAAAGTLKAAKSGTETATGEATISGTTTADMAAGTTGAVGPFTSATAMVMPTLAKAMPAARPAITPTAAPIAGDNGAPDALAATTAKSSATVTNKAAAATPPGAAAAKPNADTAAATAVAEIRIDTAAAMSSTPSPEGLRAPQAQVLNSTSTTHPALQSAPTAVVQVYARFIERFDGRAQRFEVSLEPAELGRIDVRIEVGADRKVHAVLAAHDSSALSDLMRNQRSLERALSEAGVDLADNGLSFELADSSNRNLAQQQREDARSAADLAHAWRGLSRIEVPVENPDIAGAARAYGRRASRLDIVA